MNTLRYAIAVMLVVAIPAAIAYWFLIHPFVRVWRRVGPKLTYTVVCSLLAVLMAIIFSCRGRLLAVDYGLNPALAAIGLALLILSVWFKVKLTKELPVNVLIGLPELTPDRAPRKLITEGLFSRMRHPRYVQMTLALAGFALIANFPAAYAVLPVWLVGIRLVVVLEERELLDRFGDAYREYSRHVPRFVPSFRNRAKDK